MKRAVIVLTVFGLVATIDIAATAGVIGAPEVDISSALFSLNAAQPTTVQCAGEEGVDAQYETVSGTWRGTETEVTPDHTDYQLTGRLVYKASITITLGNKAGVMDGVATLTVPPAGGGQRIKVYSGPLTLVIVQVDQQGSLIYIGRGFLKAPTYTADSGGTSVKDGGMILANVEVSFPPVIGAPAFGSVQGQFGDQSPNEPTVPDYSAVSNGKTCA